MAKRSFILTVKDRGENIDKLLDDDLDKLVKRFKNKYG